jgi:uncharacterized caspase-like protein/Tol biopolymer transport system component
MNSLALNRFARWTCKPLQDAVVKTLYLSPMIICLFIGTPTQAEDERELKRLALIVGNDTYGGKLELKSCVNDARSIQAWLMRSGYQQDEIDLRTNVTRKQMLDALAKLTEKAKANRPKSVVIFYSGHGSTIQDDDGDERNRNLEDNRDETFLMIPNAEATLESIVIRDDEFYAATKEISRYTRQLIVLLDSCHSGGGYKSFANAHSLELAEGDTAKFVPESELRKYLLNLGLQEKSLGSLLTRSEEDEIDKRVESTSTATAKSLSIKSPTDLEIQPECTFVFIAACDELEVAIAGGEKSNSKFTKFFLAAVEPQRAEILAAANADQLTLPLLMANLREKLFRYKQTPVAFAANSTAELAIGDNLFPLSQDQKVSSKIPFVEPQTETSQVLQELRDAHKARTRVASKPFRYQANKAQSLPAPTVSLCFSPDGRYLCVGEANTKTVYRALGRDSVEAKRHAMPRLWDLKSGREVRRFGGHEGKYIQSVSISQDNSLMSSTCFTPYGARIITRIPEGEDVRVWSVNTGEELLHLPNEGVKATLTSDGKWLIVVGTGHVHGYLLTRAMKEKTPEPTWSYRCDANIYVQPVISPDDRRVAIAVDTDKRTLVEKLNVVILDTQTGDVKGSLPTSPNHMSWSRNGSLLLSAERSSVSLLDVEREIAIRKFDFEAEPEVVVFDHDEKHALAVASNGEYRKWNLETGKEQAAMKFGRLADFAFSPDRRFLAFASDDEDAVGTIDLIELKTGNRFVRLHQFHEDRAWLAETIDGFIQGPDDFLRTETLVLETQGLKQKPDRVQKVLAELQPKLVNEEMQRQAKPKVNSRLFVLSVGVSKYKYAEYDLKHAADDATSLDKFFRDRRYLAFDDVVTQVYTNEDATAANLKKGLQWLQSSCTEHDTAVILFSGHGITGRNGLYFVTHEGDEEGIQYTCLNWSLVAATVAKIQAKSVVFLADCCHAGAFAGERRPVQSDIAKEFSEKPGLFFYCSSKGSQISQEIARLGHGVFTYAVLEALTGKADIDQSKTVTLEELRSYVDKRVIEITEGKQTPYLPYPTNHQPSTVVSQVPKQEF